MVTIKRFLPPRQKRLSRSVWGNVLMFLFIGAVGSLMAFPLVYAVVTAFKPMDEIFVFPPRFFVRNPTMDNFRQVGHIVNNSWVPLGRYVVNSILVSAGGTAGTVFVSCLAAYPLAKLPFTGKRIYGKTVIWAILFRSEVTGVAVYMILAKLGMINTYWSMILPAMAGSFGVFLMQQFMVSYPDAVLEAAHIDGASEWRIFRKLVMPGVKPGWITLTIFSFQTFWNATNVNYIYREDFRLLPAVLSQIASGGIARAGAGSAVALLLMIPPILIFVISQSSVLETMALSGIKE